MSNDLLRYTFASSARRACWLASVVILLVGCNQERPPGPAAAPAQAGDVVLLYIRASNSEYFFDLENHMSHPIYFRGTKSFWSDTTPVDTSIECTDTKSKEATVSAFPIIDSARGHEPPHIKVSPGERIRLRLNTAEGDGASLAQFKGGHCQIRLRLLNTNEVVESNEFQS